MLWFTIVELFGLGLLAAVGDCWLFPRFDFICSLLCLFVIAGMPGWCVGCLVQLICSLCGCIMLSWFIC